MNEKIKVSFIDIENKVALGSIMITFSAVTKLNIGDRIEFKDNALGFGIFEIQSFALNHGFPEGNINVIPLKAKARIKLHEVNLEYLDSLLPF